MAEKTGKEKRPWLKGLLKALKVFGYVMGAWAIGSTVDQVISLPTDINLLGGLIVATSNALIVFAEEEIRRISSGTSQ